MFGHRKHKGHHGQNWEDWGRRFKQRGFRRPKYNIPVNIIEHETGFEVWVHALTFGKDHVKVSIVGDMLYITGKREPSEEYPNFILQEYPIKSFERSFELSHRVDKSGIKARYVDGVLVVDVPKNQEEMEPEQEIDIE